MIEEKNDIKILKADEMTQELMSMSAMTFNSKTVLSMIDMCGGKEKFLDMIISNSKLLFHMISLLHYDYFYKGTNNDYIAKYKIRGLGNLIAYFPAYEEKIKSAFVGYLLQGDKSCFIGLSFFEIIEDFPEFKEKMFEVLLSNSDLFAYFVNNIQAMDHVGKKFPEYRAKIEDKFILTILNNDDFFDLNVGFLKSNNANDFVSMLYYVEALIKNFPNESKKIQIKFIDRFCRNDELLESFFPKNSYQYFYFKELMRILKDISDSKCNLFEKIAARPKLLNLIFSDKVITHWMIISLPECSVIFEACYMLSIAIKNKDSQSIKNLHNELKEAASKGTINCKSLQIGSVYLEGILNSPDFKLDQSEFSKNLFDLYMGVSKIIAEAKIYSGPLGLNCMFPNNNTMTRLRMRERTPNSLCPSGLPFRAPEASEESQSQAGSVTSNSNNNF